MSAALLWLCVQKHCSHPGEPAEKDINGARGGLVKINDQYRVCFVWSDGNAHDAEIVDYH